MKSDKKRHPDNFPDPIDTSKADRFGRGDFITIIKRADGSRPPDPDAMPPGSKIELPIKAAR